MQQLRLLPQQWQLGLPLLVSVQQSCAFSLPAAFNLQQVLQQQQQHHHHNHQQQQQQQQQLPQMMQQAFRSASTAAAASKQALSLHERRAANLKYCQERAKWRLQVKELRKQWLKEHQQKLAAHRAAAEEARQQISQLRAQRKESRKEDFERLTLEREVRQAVRAVEAAERKLAGAYREQLRQTTLKQFRDSQRAELLEESRSWIHPEALEERVAEALNNPLPL